MSSSFSFCFVLSFNVMNAMFIWEVHVAIAVLFKNTDAWIGNYPHFPSFMNTTHLPLRSGMDELLVLSEESGSCLSLSVLTWKPLVTSQYYS